MEKGAKNLLILVGVIGVGVLAYYLYDRSKKKGGKFVSGVNAENKQNTVTFTRS
jgi:hypothetical protein